MSENNALTNKWVRITSIDNIPLREGRAVEIAGRDIAIFNLGDRLLALENRCPHRGGPLADGIVTGGNVVCPLHAWKVDLATGEVINQANNPPCVKTFRARVEDGVVLLEIPAVRSAQVSSNCFASISQGPYLNSNVSSEV